MTGMSCGDACAHRPNGSTRALRTIGHRARANHDPPMISSCSEGQCSGSVLDGTRRSPELDETRLVRVQIQSESRNPARAEPEGAAQRRSDAGTPPEVVDVAHDDDVTVCVACSTATWTGRRKSCPSPTSYWMSSGPPRSRSKGIQYMPNGFEETLHDRRLAPRHPSSINTSSSHRAPIAPTRVNSTATAASHESQRARRRCGRQWRSG